jgi:hypothetical protein
MLLSESQRVQRSGPPIYAPAEFFATPRGICVDLARFAVETMRAIAPNLQPRYVMIEFDPQTVHGNILRRHWVASFERNGKYYFFADSKRPGYIAGPYASIQDYMSEYSAYRGRGIVEFRELESFMRRSKTPAARQNRAADA